MIELGMLLARCQNPEWLVASCLRLMFMPPLPLVVRVQYLGMAGREAGAGCGAAPSGRVRARPHRCRQEVRAAPSRPAPSEGPPDLRGRQGAGRR